MAGRGRGSGRSTNNANTTLAQTPARFSGGEIIGLQTQPHDGVSIVNLLNISRIDPAVNHINTSSTSSPLLYQAAGLQRTGLNTFVESRRAPVNYAVYADGEHEEHLRRRMRESESPHTSDTVAEPLAEQQNLNTEDQEAAQSDRRHVLPSLHATDRVLLCIFFLIQCFKF